VGRSISRTTGKDKYVLEEQIGFVLRRAHQRHVAIFAQCMKGIDLTPTQFSALVRLADKGPVSQNQLGRLTAMDPATILGVVQRLEQRGLVVRNSDAGRAQTILLALTESGRKLAEKAVIKAVEATRRTLEPVSTAQGRQLRRLLQKIAE
jgi:MarR family transcriptional regulator, lower aerobic nicotinate degradation pathway regulator